MKQILVPLDGSELAESALDPGIRLAERPGGRLILASVVPDVPVGPVSSGGAEGITSWIAAEQERIGSYLDGIRSRVEGEHPGATVEARVGRGPVASTLEEIAEDVDADLIVLTTHGRGSWQRAWLGSVADALLRGTGRPLLLLRESGGSGDLLTGDGAPRRVLVPVDGSRESEEVLVPLARLLEAGGAADVTLLSVVDERFPFATTYIPHAIEEERLTEEEKDEARQRLRELAREWAPERVSTHVEVTSSNDVPRTILEVAEREGMGLLALATRGRGGVGRLLLGSVADKVIRGTRVPVLALRRGGAGKEG